MKATFKRAELSDIARLMPMMCEFYAIDGYGIDRAHSETLWRTFISDPALGSAWIIFADEACAGYVIVTLVFSFEYGGRIAFIDELYVAEAFRGKSIGRQTVDFIKSESQAEGYKVLYLEIERHNSVAEKLYLAAGFQKHHRNLMQYKINTSS